MLAIVKDYAKVALCLLCRALQHLFFWLPVRKNRILFDPYVHVGYGGNPKYVAEWLLDTQPQGAYELIWASSDPSSCPDAQARGIRVIQRKSMRHLWLHFTANIIVYSDMLYLPLARRSKQTYIQTWHGGIAYKRIGLASLSFTHAVQGALFHLQNPPPDHFVSSSGFFTTSTAEAFAFSPALFLPIGTPRNDLLFGDTETPASKVRLHYGIESGARVALYAPTFRASMDAADYALDAKALRDALTTRFGGEWTLLLRHHGFLQPQKHGGDSPWLDVSAWPDMQELLCACDVLLSDYSSCMWDYSFLLRPIFVYAPDMEAYMREDRGFTLPPEEWPYPIAQDNEALKKAILDYDGDRFADSLRAHHKALDAYETGHAAAKLGEMIVKATR